MLRILAGGLQSCLSYRSLNIVTAFQNLIDTEVVTLYFLKSGLQLDFFEEYITYFSPSLTSEEKH